MNQTFFNLSQTGKTCYFYDLNTMCQKINISLSEINLYSKVSFVVFVLIQILRFIFINKILNGKETDEKKIKLLHMFELMDYISYPFLIYALFSMFSLFSH